MCHTISFTLESLKQCAKPPGYGTDCSNIFHGFMKKCALRRILPIFFTLAENFVISSCVAL